MANVGPVFVTIFGGIILLAVVSVVVSQKGQAPQVLTSGGQALAAVIGAAVAPVTGSTGNVFGSSGIGSAITAQGVQ